MSARELIQEQVALGPRTTLGVGGPARRFARVHAADQLLALIELAGGEGWPFFVLGGGSNLLVHDRGLDALVVQLANEDIEQQDDALLRVGAGRSWDALVRWAVQRDLAGIECLSGIPGFVGAAPIQNIGAYGQELSETLERVDAVHIRSGERTVFESDDCAFGYRDSFFKRSREWIVTDVWLRLRPGGAPTLRYADLKRALRGRPELRAVRDTVLQVRRSKGMVLDDADPESRSAGSFFTNPIVDSKTFQALGEALSKAPEEIPHWESENGVKLSAAWLIEQSGFTKGHSMGGARLSRKHVLAVVNDGGATASELLELAKHIHLGVLDRCSIRLVPEPRLWGFTAEELAPFDA